MEPTKEKDAQVEVVDDAKLSETRTPPSPTDSPHVDAALAHYVHDPENRKRIEKKLLWKLDTRFMPTVIIIFILNYIDRTNVSSARLSGLQTDLNLSDVQYESCIAILYSSYITFQVPSNLLLNYVSRPSLYIPTMVILWGMVSALTGVTQDFTGAALCRVAIGIPEAAFYPGTIYLLSRWYTKKELALRSAWLYSGLIISNAFGSLMAAGILGNMEGKLGVRGWRWLFYIEGAITMFVGFVAMYTLPDYPRNTRWLNAEERLVAQQRLSEDAGEADQDSPGDTAWQGLKLAITDPKVPVFMVMTFTQLLGLSFVNFFPTLTQTLGYSTTVTLLLCAPPWGYAFIVCLSNGRHADATGERYGHLIWTWVGVIVGYVIAMSTQATAARYVSLFLMAAGYAGFALTLVWVSNSFPRPPVKRAAAIGFVNGFGNLGNLVGSYVWASNWGPIYRQSMGIAMAGLVVAILLALVIRQMLVKQNKDLDRLDAVMNDAGIDRADLDRLKATAEIEGIALNEAAQMKKGYVLSKMRLYDNDDCVRCLHSHVVNDETNCSCIMRKKLRRSLSITTITDGSLMFRSRRTTEDLSPQKKPRHQSFRWLFAVSGLSERNATFADWIQVSWASFHVTACVTDARCTTRRRPSKRRDASERPQ